MRDKNHGIIKFGGKTAPAARPLGEEAGGLRSDRGSALMLVMISIAFIGILAVVLLGISYTNLRLKTLDGRSRVNYYTAETAIAEIQGVLEEYAADALTKAYEEQLDDFIDTTSSERTARLKNTYFTTMRDKLKHASAPGKYDAEKLQSFTTKGGQGVTIVDYSSDISSKGALEYNVAKETLTLKNVRVEYEANGLKSSITTDIVIGLPDNGDDAVGYLDYALISDELINITNNVNVDVKGGVYAGHKMGTAKNGIIVGNDIGTGDVSSLRIDGKGADLISRSDVKVYNKSSMLVNNGTLWVKNIVLGSTADFKQTQATGADLAITGDAEQLGPQITVDATTNVKGDLYLNARYSKAVFSDAYYGYSLGGATGAASNSAIVINGYGSSLDMSGINELFIAGRSFVASDGTTGDPTGGVSSADILEGESIATKKNETIYLVNSKYLIDRLGSNPTSADTLEEIITAPAISYGSKQFTDQIIKMTEVSGSPGTYEYVSGFKAIYDNFLDPNEPIKCFFTPSPRVVYFYLNFKNEEKAQDYVRYYYNNSTENKDMFNSNVEVFLNNNKIKINAQGARYAVVGAVIANFNNDANPSLKQDPVLLTNTQLMDEVQDYNERYLSLQTTLKRHTGYDEAKFNAGYVASVVNIPNVEAVNASVSSPYIINGPGDTAIYLVDNDGPGDAPFVVDENTKHGIVVATGDVRLGALSATNPYKGLIMSVGKIYTNGGAAEAYCQADSDMLLDLFEFIGKDELEKYFREYPGQVALSTDYTKSIDFENWVKDGDR